MEERKIDINKCPFCGAREIEMCEIEQFANDIVIHCSCEECHAAWELVSKIEGIQNVER